MGHVEAPHPLHRRAQVELRAAARSAPALNLSSALDAFAAPARLAGRFERLRRQLGWDITPVLRNRTSGLFGIMETPWDSFGPPPPIGSDTRQLLEAMGKE